MEITSVDVMQIDAQAPKNRADCRPVYCRIHTSDGLYGDGEAGVMMMSGGGGVAIVLRDYAKQIIGLDPIENEVIMARLRRNYFSVNGGPIVQAALSAIDTALWDIKGKAFGVPVHQLLGGKMNDDLRCYASQINYGWGRLQSDAATPEEYAARAAEAIAEGYDAVKADFLELDLDGTPLTVKERRGIFAERNLKATEARVAAVREVMGDGDIIFECHGFTDSNTALQIAERIKKYRIAYMEEPETTFFPTLKQLQEKIDIPLAMGERLFSRRMYLPFLLNQTVQVIQPDIGNCGGITEIMRIADIASLFDIGVQCHCAGSPLCMAATLQVEAAIPNFLIHEHCCVQERDYVRRLAKYDYMPVNGRLSIPDLPGIGNELSDYVLLNCQKETVQ